MTRKTDYTSGEWSLLTNAVATVGLGMLAVSSASLIGRLRELATLSRCLSPRAVPLQFRQNELVLALLDELIDPVDPVAPAQVADGQTADMLAYLSRGDAAGLTVAVLAAYPRMLHMCEQVTALLANKRIPVAEADGMKRWLLWVARSIAEASGNRWLGLGRKVSDKETSMLHAIADALHISPIARVPTVAQLDALLGPAPYSAEADRGQRWR